LSLYPAGTASPCPLTDPCHSSPPANDAPGPAPCTGPKASPSGAAPTPTPDTGLGTSASAPPTRFTQPVHVYQRRARPALLLQSPLVASSPPTTPTPPVASSPPATPTPPVASSALTTPTPPQPTAARVMPLVYHPPLLHRHQRHVHPMVTRHAAGTLRPRALAAMPGDPQVSPVPSSVRDALSDPH